LDGQANRCTQKRIIEKLQYQQNTAEHRKTWVVVKENIFGSDNRHSIKEISKDRRTVTDPTNMANSCNKYFSEMTESISNLFIYLLSINRDKLQLILILT
jgi:hypothetical protein